MGMKTFILLLGFLGVFLSGQAQFVPPSPNASALGFYADVPVSKYTGVPRISLPLYVVEAGEIQVPLSLNYHASGIKVAQEASWVGLGWSLFAGGVITRSVRGNDDFASDGFYHTGALPAVGADNDLSVEESDYLSYYYYNDINKGLRDGEADVFFFNFNGHTGKFFFTKESKKSTDGYLVPLCAKQTALSIKYYKQDQEFTIIDEFGVIYTFSDIEKKRLNQYTDESRLPPGGRLPSDDDADEFICSWYLSSIVSPTGKSVTFKYNKRSNFKVLSQRHCSEHIHRMIDGGGGHVRGNGYISPSLSALYRYYTTSESVSDEIYLSEIVYGDYSVRFSTSDRLDINTPSRQVLKAQKLDSLFVYNKEERVSSWGFSFSYFNTGTKTASIRLRLDSLQQMGTDKGVQKYTFSYDQRYMPEKNSNAIDHWGYYNAYNNQQLWGYEKKRPGNGGTLIPPVSRTGRYKGIHIKGANREVNPLEMQAGILKAIQYPSGGRVLFDYEPNTYSNFESYNEGIFKDLAWAYYSDEVYDKDTLFFHINEPQDVDYSTSFTLYGKHNYSVLENGVSIPSSYHFATLKKIEGDGRLVKIKDLKVPSGYYFSDEMLVDEIDHSVFYSTSSSLPLEAGHYCIVREGTYSDASFSGKIRHKVSDRLIRQKNGGGLRIKQITKDTGGSILTQHFHYDLEDSLSSGKLMSKPVYHYDVLLQESPHIILPGHVIQYEYFGYYVVGMSSSYYPIGYSASGYPVGYSRVSVEESSEGRQGKTVYYYRNKEDSIVDLSDRVLPGYPNIAYRDNGQLLRADYFDNKGQLIRQQENTYVKDAEHAFSFKAVNV